LCRPSQTSQQKLSRIRVQENYLGHQRQILPPSPPAREDLLQKGQSRHLHPFHPFLFCSRKSRRSDQNKKKEANQKLTPLLHFRRDLSPLFIPLAKRRREWWYFKIGCPPTYATPPIPLRHFYIKSSSTGSSFPSVFKPRPFPWQSFH
jgi:hypothetical protein